MSTSRLTEVAAGRGKRRNDAEIPCITGLNVLPRNIYDVAEPQTS